MVASGLPSIIVGRERETSELRRWLDAALSGDGGLVLVGGETGIGKTTLLNRLASEARQRGVHVLTGAADDLSASSPYGPWIDLLHDYPTDTGLPNLPQWLNLDASMERFDSRGTLFHEAHRFLSAVSDRSPLLLILEDLHWSDTASLELLRYLNRRLNQLPILLVASYRTEEISSSTPMYHLLPDLVREGAADRIHLGRLAPADTRALIAHRYRLPAFEQDRFTRYVQEHAEGNPLFITELLRVLEDERIIEWREGSWRLGTLDRVPVPPLVRQIVDGRLRRLDENLRRLLSIAAVLGRDVSFEIWQKVSDADDLQLERAIEAGIEHGILTQWRGASLSFNHALIREVMQAGIILPRRRNLHRRIAETLMEATHGERDPDRIAVHLQAARDERAAEWLVQAGKRACGVYAYEVARERLDSALQLIGDRAGTLKLQALRTRALAFEMIGRFDEALADQQAALSVARELGDEQEKWQTLLDLGDLWSGRDYQEARAYFQQALDLARAIGDPGTLAHSLNRMGNWYSNIDQPRDGLEHHREALRLFQESGDEPGIARTLDLLGIATYMHGDPTTSAAHYRDAVRLFREQGDRRGLASSLPTMMLLGGSYDTDTLPVALGSQDEWLRIGAEGLEVATEIGWRSAEAYTLSHIGYVLGLRGEYQRAIELAREGLDLATDIDHREWITAGHFVYGTILIDLLNTSAARTHIEQAYDAAWATHSTYWSRATSAALATAHLIQGEFDRAQQVLRRVLDDESRFDSMGIRQCWFRRADLELARGNPEDALDIAERLLRTVPGPRAEQSVPHLEWLKLRALTDLDRTGDAAAALALARGSAETLGYRSLLWRVELAAGQLHLRKGEMQESQSAMNRGRQIVIELAGQITDTLVSEEFRDRALSMFPVDRGTDAGDLLPFGLSQREREVLTLVTRGLTDAEVGDRLFISPRTVGRHLQSIYGKLGVNSRTAAARLALEQHLV